MNDIRLTVGFVIPCIPYIYTGVETAVKNIWLIGPYVFVLLTIIRTGHKFRYWERESMLKKKDRGRKWEGWNQPGWMPGFALALTLTTVQADASPLGQMLTFDLPSHARSQVLLQSDRLSVTITILITSLSCVSSARYTHTDTHSFFIT